MQWIEVSVRVAPSWVDLAGDRLLRFAPQGFWDSRDAQGRRRVLRAYVPATAAGRAAIRHLVKALTFTLPGAPVKTRTVSDADWVGAWKAGARRHHIGRLIVQPTWMRDSPSGGLVIRLDPGMAFGSGEHASTRLCLRALERHVRPGSTVIDLGTGSGILAVAAVRLGAARVLAVDNDPAAVAVARANARVNRVTRRVSVHRGDGLARVQVRADLIAANLTADTLPAVLAGVRRCLIPGGRFIASGFGAARVPEVRRHIVRAGLAVAGTERLQGWCAVHATRPVRRRA